MTSKELVQSRVRKSQYADPTNTSVQQYALMGKNARRKLFNRAVKQLQFSNGLFYDQVVRLLCGMYGEKEYKRIISLWRLDYEINALTVAHDRTNRMDTFAHYVSVIMYPTSSKAYKTKE